MKRNQYILITTDAVRGISAAEALQYLTLSPGSREQLRHLRHYDRTRELVTSFSGILSLTGIDVNIEVYAVIDGLWLMSVSIGEDNDAGTPSAATPILSPCPLTRRASGTSRIPLLNPLIQPYYESYWLARWNRARPVHLALPGAINYK